MSEQLISTSVGVIKIFSEELSVFSILVRKIFLNSFFFQVNKDKGSSRKAVYFKFGMAGIFAM